MLLAREFGEIQYILQSVPWVSWRGGSCPVWIQGLSSLGIMKVSVLCSLGSLCKSKACYHYYMYCVWYVNHCRWDSMQAGVNISSVYELRDQSQSLRMYCAQSCSFATAWTAARQAPLSMGFSRQEYWSGLPCPPPGDLPNPGIEPRSPTLQADSSLSEPPGKRSGPQQRQKWGGGAQAGIWKWIRVYFNPQLLWLLI